MRVLQDVSQWQLPQSEKVVSIGVKISFYPKAKGEHKQYGKKMDNKQERLVVSTKGQSPTPRSFATN